MNSQKLPNKNTNSEVNLKMLFRRIFKNKLLFAVSIFLCLAGAFAYLKTTTPTYLVQTSLLIDSNGKSRLLGSSSKYVDGGVGLIGMEKNLYNEMGIIKSYSLVNKTLKDLDFGVSYFTGTWYKKQEYYGYFPFEIKVTEDAPQMYGSFFQVIILNEAEYILKINTKEFSVSNPATKTSREMTSKFEFSKKYRFGELVKHDYFEFSLVKPAYEVMMGEFEGKDLFFRMNSLTGMTNSFISKMTVQQTDIQASILTVQTEGATVSKEIKFLEKLNQNFIQNKFIERSAIASSKEGFIQKQLDSIKTTLDAAERNLETFKRGTNSVDLSRSGALGLDQLQKLETEKGQIILNQKYYTSLLNYITINDGIEKAVSPSAVGIIDPILNENLMELKRLHEEKVKFSYSKGAKSMDLKILQKRIDNTSAALKENVRNLMRFSEIALSDKTQRIEKLELALNELPANEKKLLNYERKATLNGNLYNYLSQELAKNNIARAENTPDVKVLDQPRRMGSGPIAPQKLLIMLLGGIVGAMLPLAWLVFSNSLDNTIDDVSHLEGITNIPVAASIFHSDKKLNLATKFAGQWQVKESFRDLGANLQFLIPDANKNVIGITSTISGEGKTFCATCLAMSLAMEGKKVALIDLNFRNPSLWEKTDEYQGMELTEFLTGKDMSPEKVIHRYSGIPNLSIIPTYTERSNPHKLLGNVQLEMLIQKVKYDFDFVIIDSSPVGLVSDYLLISKYIDIHLFTIRRKVSKFLFLEDLEDLRDRGKMENAFLIFNDEKNSNKKKGYSYTAVKESDKVKQPSSIYTSWQRRLAPDLVQPKKGN
ncbi:MAG: GumC family protein [Saprospiraceae bacterium]